MESGGDQKAWWTIYAVNPVQEDDYAVFVRALKCFQKDAGVWDKFSKEAKWPYKSGLMELLQRIDNGTFDDICKRYYRSSILEIVTWWRENQAKKFGFNLEEHRHMPQSPLTSVDAAIRFRYLVWGLRV